MRYKFGWVITDCVVVVLYTCHDYVSLWVPLVNRCGRKTQIGVEIAFESGEGVVGVHPTEIRTSISPSLAVELNTTSALANYATKAGFDTINCNSLLSAMSEGDVQGNVKTIHFGRSDGRHLVTVGGAPGELLRTAMPTVSMCYESLSDPISTSLRCVVQAVTAAGVASSKTPLATVACGCCRHVLLRSYPRTSIRGSVHAFTWKESRNPFWKKKSISPTRDQNLYLPIIGSLVYCKSSALDHAATKVGSWAVPNG
ncbi:unnamed protein product [Timema podura]|uniref:Uncharacterized protein n=1 Tax=Timema podura TaxID=61482 RepID=A0ABN7NJK9_TIMPD|nr:unnamed protein product [Timema podura]